jgi:protein tyrosine phosphatase
MNHIIDNIYLGNAEDAREYDLLKTKKITHILTAAIEQETPFINSFTYLKFPLYDSPYTDISKFIIPAIEFILDSQQKGGNILIHCAAGISRSASIVIAYLIIKKKMTYTQAYIFVKQKRPIINPNEGFQKSLIELSYQIHKMA